MTGTWPVTVPILMWRARRWRGLLWFAAHGVLLLGTVMVAQMVKWVVVEMLSF